MKIIDISREIGPESPVYPGDDAVEAHSLCEAGAEGSPCSITTFSGWTTHFLTHVDPPKHFVPGGASLDEIGLDRFVTPCRVVDVAGDFVTAADVPDLSPRSTILFRTRNSTHVASDFDENHVFVSAEAAERLVELRANLVGFDYLSVDQFGSTDYPAHRTLLQNDVLILEGLNLKNVAPGEYDLIALPLRIRGADGSPVRAVLMAPG